MASTQAKILCSRSKPAPSREGEAPAEPVRRKTAPQERRPPNISETKTGGTKTVVNPSLKHPRLARQTEPEGC